jgi:hypothetical protein
MGRAVTLLNFIREVNGLNLVGDTDCADFSWILSARPGYITASAEIVQ